MQTFTKEEIEDLTKRVLTTQIGRYIGDDPIADDSTLASIGFDSLDAVEVFMAIEEEFEVYKFDAWPDEYDDPASFIKLTVRGLIDSTIEAVKKNGNFKES